MPPEMLVGEMLVGEVLVGEMLVGEVLVGVEHEYQLDPLRGPLDFRQMIHALDVDGARLDPGDVYAYRLRSGAVLTADGVTAEVATPPVPSGPDCADTLIDLQDAGLAELMRVVPDGTPIFGYSTHISVSVPQEPNDELCALYARTFGPALMFQMNSITTEGIYIRPRPGRIEFCGNYLSNERLRGAATFAAASVQACRAFLDGDESALGALPGGLEVVVSADPIRYGLHLSADSFAPGDGGRDQDLVLRRSDGSITLGELLAQSWRAVQSFLPQEPAPAAGEVIESPAPAGIAIATRRSATTEAQRQLAVYGAILEGVVRPRFSVSAVVAVWDFTIFEVSHAARRAYVAVPRTLLPSFWSELRAGARDAEIEAFVRTPQSGRVLETSEQTREFGLWDEVVVGTRLLSPERLPSPTVVEATSEVGGTSERTQPSTDGDASVGPTGPARPASAESEARPVVSRDGAPRPGKRPRSLIPGHAGTPTDGDASAGDDEVPGRPGKRIAEMDPGRLGKIPLESPPLISIPSPFGRPLWLGLLIALLVVVVVVVLLALTGGSSDGTPSSEDDPGGTTTATAAPTETSVVTAALPVVSPISAFLEPPTTTYSVEASSPDGLELTYRWTLVADAGEDCGTITPSDAGVASAGRTFVQWSHANESPDDCNHDADDHPFNIEVEVSDGVNAPVIRTYRGSNTGVGPTE